MYRIDTDAIIILDVFRKKSPETLKTDTNVCKARLKS
jgi:phage-related protein